jgi:hypothetical protein
MRDIHEHSAYLSAARKRAEAGLKPLVHSLSEARELLISIISSTGARSVCEIGSEGGLLTAALHDLYSSGLLDCLTIIEPFPTETVLSYADGQGCVVDARLSLESLRQLQAHDIYIVDGDHNYYTVHGELTAIFDRCDPLVILHDVCWPCAERDQYYQPQTIPADKRNPYSMDAAIVHGKDELVEFGFSSNGNFGIATAIGGDGNGVFRAVFDVAMERGLVFDSIPALFGIGFLRNPTYASENALVSCLPSRDINALLSRIDENRMENYLVRIRLENLLRQAELARDDFHSGRVGLFELFKAAFRNIRNRVIAL